MSNENEYFIRDGNKIVVITGFYTANFSDNRVWGKIELQGLKVEFEGVTDRVPNDINEANEIIKSLFLQPPKQVRNGAIVEAENDRVKIKAWGIIVKDVNALFNRLSEIKVTPVDITKLSLYYDLPPKKVKKILKENPLSLSQIAYADFLSRFGNKLPRVEDVKEFKIILDISQEFGEARLIYNGKQLYKVKVSYSTLAHYLELSPKELLEEMFSSLEGIVNLLGKASNGTLPGVVELEEGEEKIVIRSENEEATLPVSVDKLKEYLKNLREKVYSNN
ncbi:MAG: hypothetical protein RQ872_08620 [Sulfolobaceae archaeon]|nr:hypothetical protein [Sulfolobaceae archaeon]